MLKFFLYKLKDACLFLILLVWVCLNIGKEIIFFFLVSLMNVIHFFVNALQSRKDLFVAFFWKKNKTAFVNLGNELIEAVLTVCNAEIISCEDFYYSQKDFFLWWLNKEKKAFWDFWNLITIPFFFLKKIILRFIGPSEKPYIILSEEMEREEMEREERQKAERGFLMDLIALPLETIELILTWTYWILCWVYGESCKIIKELKNSEHRNIILFLERITFDIILFIQLIITRSLTTHLFIINKYKQTIYSKFTFKNIISEANKYRIRCILFALSSVLSFNIWKGIEFNNYFIWWVWFGKEGCFTFMTFCLFSYLWRFVLYIKLTYFDKKDSDFVQNEIFRYTKNCLLFLICFFYIFPHVSILEDVFDNIDHFFYLKTYGGKLVFRIYSNYGVHWLFLFHLHYFFFKKIFKNKQ